MLWSLFGETCVVNGNSTGRGVRRMGSLPFKLQHLPFGELRVVSLLSDDNSCSRVAQRVQGGGVYEDPALPPLHLPLHSTPFSGSTFLPVSVLGSNRGCFPHFFLLPLSLQPFFSLPFILLSLPDCFTSKGSCPWMNSLRNWIPCSGWLQNSHCCQGDF